MPRDTSRENAASERRQATASFSGDRFSRAATELLASLPERTRAIVDTRFGVSSGSPRTLADIGQREHISRERVRQIVETGLARLRREQQDPEGPAARARHAILVVGRASGGVLEEELLLKEAETDIQARGALRLVLAIMPELTEARETQRTAAHWVLATEANLGGTLSLEVVLEAAEQLLTHAGRVLPEKEFLSELRRAVHETLPENVARVFLSISMRVVRTPLGGYGLRSWREAVPRSVGDKATVVLRTEGKPMHFRTVADAINRVGFDGKRALPETVHNDLIRDQRFVLVGRGLYALREWGYVPGRVAEVIERVLRSAGRPLTKAEIIVAVLKERFVKRNTIVLSLQNHDRFQALSDGTYTLAAPRAAEDPLTRGLVPSGNPGDPPTPASGRRGDQGEPPGDVPVA